jgi:hypothetical protein
MLYSGEDSAKLYHEDGPNCAALFEFRENLLLYYMASNAALVMGHALFSERAFKHFGSSYRFVTIMRDPVARLVSNYHASGLPVSEDFGTYLRSDIARRQALVFLRYFAGVADISPGDEPVLLKVAHRNMACFSLIGFLDQLTDFWIGMRNLVGIEPKTFYEKWRAGDECVERPLRLHPLSFVVRVQSVRRPRTLCGSSRQCALRRRLGRCAVAGGGAWRPARRPPG